MSRRRSSPAELRQLELDHLTRRTASCPDCGCLVELRYYGRPAPELYDLTDWDAELAEELFGLDGWYAQGTGPGCGGPHRCPAAAAAIGPEAEGGGIWCGPTS